MAAHVTSWNKNASVKFRTDVAMMGKLGFDIRIHDMTPAEQEYCKGAVKNFNRLGSAILMATCIVWCLLTKEIILL